MTCSSDTTVSCFQSRILSLLPQFTQTEVTRRLCSCSCVLWSCYLLSCSRPSPCSSPFELFCVVPRRHGDLQGRSTFRSAPKNSTTGWTAQPSTRTNIRRGASTCASTTDASLVALSMDSLCYLVFIQLTLTLRNRGICAAILLDGCYTHTANRDVRQKVGMFFVCLLWRSIRC